jgi:hypothetical protein
MYHAELARTKMEIEEILNVGAYRKRARTLAIRQLLSLVL